MVQPPRNRFTIEFVQKYAKRPPISDKLLDDYVWQLQHRAKIDGVKLIMHKNKYGTQNHGFSRLVYFYSDYPYGIIKSITDKYAEEKRFYPTIRMSSLPDKKPNPVMESGGIVKLLMKPMTIKDIFG